MKNLPPGVICKKCNAEGNLPCAYHAIECPHPERWEFSEKPFVSMVAKLRAEWENDAFLSPQASQEIVSFVERLLAALEKWTRAALEAGPSQEAEDNPGLVTRFEVIDHRSDAPNVGRAFSVWGAQVELSYQDAGRTLKIFVTDRRRVPDQSKYSNLFQYR